MAAQGPVKGVTVLDFSQGMPGAIATMILSDFGAEVIKVEPPGGDPFRKHPGWISWNRGKRGVVLDLRSEKGLEEALHLAEMTDVLVESFRPGETKAFGIDYETLYQANPRLVYCSITGFGQKGHLSHYKAYDAVVSARSGRMMGMSSLVQEQRPAYPAVQSMSWAASQAAVRGMLAALLVRDRIGRGQWVQTSLLQGMIPYEGGLINRQIARRDPGRVSADPMAAFSRVPTLSYQAARCKDGRWIQMANIMPRLLTAFITAIGLGHMLEDARFKNLWSLKGENREILRDMILGRMQEKTVDEWMEIFVKDGDVGAEPFLTTVEGLNHPQIVHTKYVAEVEDPRVGPMKQLGLLADLRDTPGAIQGPAPELGQHNAEILERLERMTPRLAPAMGASDGNGTVPQYPLDGITILDLAAVVAGPYGAAILADMGARVIKVDPTPEREPRAGADGAGGMNLGNVKLTAGKEGIQIDLKTPEGQDIIHHLIARADVLLHNMRPGAPERLKIDYETCSKINPRLVHVYIGAYGDTGPYSHRPGSNAIPGAIMGGALAQAGRGMPPAPGTPLTREQLREATRWLATACGLANGDPNSSMGVATSIVLGLYGRERTGRGQQVQITMIGANAYARADDAYDYAGRPAPVQCDAQCYGRNALDRLYPAKEGWLFLACPFDHEWEAFCRTVGCADLLRDPRFQSETARNAHDDELITELTKVFVGRTAAEWEDLLTAADVACVRADVDMGDFFEHESHARDNELVVETEHLATAVGKYLRHGGIVHFSEMPGKYGPGIVPGQHTRPILRELGYSEGQIDELAARRIVHWEGADVVLREGGIP